MKLFTTIADPYSFEFIEEITPFSFEDREFLVKLLELYTIYKNSIYNSRITSELDTDVAKSDTTKFNYTFDNSDKENHLYHYAAKIGLAALTEIFKPGSKLCIAYKHENGFKVIDGFSIYLEDREKDLIYIDHIGTRTTGQGLGTKIMQQVLAQHPDKNFYLCVRKTNPIAIHVYEKEGFEINNTYLKDFDYPEEYFYGMARKQPELQNTNVMQMRMTA